MPFCAFLKVRNSIAFLFTLIAFLLLGTSANAQFYNGTHTDFGKNRVQYRDFDWQFYRFENYETYFYTGGRDLAEYTARYVDQRLKELKKFIDYYPDDKLQFIIYNKHSDFKQSNIGLSADEMYNVGGVTRIVGSKVFLYFEGDFQKFNQQIDAGITEVLIYQMLYGGNWREVLRNSTLIHLPPWYVNGLISYVSRKDDPQVFNRIKDGIANGQYKKFNNLQGEEAKIAGHAMWNYIAATYGENVISNILYMTRISRDLDDGFLFVIGISFAQLTEDWIAYYENRLLANEHSPAPPSSLEVKRKKSRVYHSLRLSPKGDKIAYVSNELGQYRVYLYDLNTDKRTKLFKQDHKIDRITDYSYPVIDWHPSGKMLSYIVEYKGDLLLHSYYLEDKSTEIKPIFFLEKITHFDYSDDGKNIVVSANTKGQSDIYVLNLLSNTQQKITQDKFDDVQPVFINGSSQIAFASNRPTDTLFKSNEVELTPTNKDIFIYDLQEKGDVLSRVTNSSDIDEYNPMEFDGQISYLSNDNGRVKRYTAVFDSAISRIDTSIHYRYFYNESLLHEYDRNILEQNASPKAAKYSQIIYRDNRYQFIVDDLSSPTASQTESPVKEAAPKSIPSNSGFRIDKAKRLQTAPDNSRQSKALDFDNYTFNTPTQQKKDNKPAKRQVSRLNDKKDTTEFALPLQRLYRLNFRPDNSILQLNNMFLNGQYQIFNGGPYVNAGLGATMQIGIVDLMEDYRIFGGVRYSGDLTEYSLTFQDMKHRLDKEYRVARSKQRLSNAFSAVDVKTIRLDYTVNWPISEVASLRGGFSVRNDKIVPLAIDLFSLRAEINNQYWASARTAYVFDNTRNIALNIRYGLRFKIFAEQYIKAYDELANGNPFNSNDDVNREPSNMTVLGFDFRHYQKIHREFIWVNRFAGSTSFGSEKLVYYLGGVDDWWRSNIFDNSTPIDQTQNYRYQALAANMRGFLQNIRNGNSFAVINSELRLPIFAYFIHRPIQSDFVRNFQIIGFGDVGTAWVGTSPFAADNPISNEVIPNGPITVTLENVNDPVVGGFGFGLRTTLLGYFIRADWAWGVENGIVSDESIFYLSLSLDI